jgi:hypothetical protein
MAWCDPCTADPLTPAELRGAGVFWLDEAGNPGGGANPVMLTRMHLRYTRDTFPEDLAFIETADQQNFQTRYVLRHPYNGVMNCSEADPYRQQVRDRREREALTLNELTGWSLADSRKLAGLDGPSDNKATRGWWSKLWH